MKNKKKLDNTNSCILSLPYTSFKCSKIATQIIRTVKKFLPEYEIRIVFSTIRLNFSILPTIKPSKPTLETTNSIYSFLCPCDSEYIGESKRSLKTRISEHKTPSRKSSVQDHISSCQEYKSSLRKFKRDFARENIHCPSNEIEKTFLQQHFKVLEPNLWNRNERKVAEAIHITLNLPELNRQVSHRKTKFLCSCPLSKPDGALIGAIT